MISTIKLGAKQHKKANAERLTKMAETILTPHASSFFG
jgi:hypothetical protein